IAGGRRPPPQRPCHEVSRGDRARDPDHDPGLPGTARHAGAGLLPGGADGPLRAARGGPARRERRVRCRARDRARQRLPSAPCGAAAEVTADGEPPELWESHALAGGTTPRIGVSPGPGFRLYLAVDGGFDVPLLFGSRATYTMGALGGLDGRPLQAGDRLSL